MADGCCTACGGQGGTRSGPCFDCYGTGHPHPDPESCATPTEREAGDVGEVAALDLSRLREALRGERPPFTVGRGDVLALLDRLEAAEAHRDWFRQQADHHIGRANRAEQELPSLRAKVARVEALLNGALMVPQAEVRRALAPENAQDAL